MRSCVSEKLPCRREGKMVAEALKPEVRAGLMSGGLSAWGIVLWFAFAGMSEIIYSGSIYSWV